MRILRIVISPTVVYNRCVKRHISCVRGSCERVKQILVIGSLNMDTVIEAPYMPKSGETPAGSMPASLLFAFAQAPRINVDFALPKRILQMAPYLLTLVVLIGFGRRVQGPQAADDIQD